MPYPKSTDLDMTKHSDYFVWKDTSERVARRCDYTVDKKRVNSCVLKHLFLEGVEQPKISPKKPRNALSDALLMSRFQNIAADAATKKNGFLLIYGRLIYGARLLAQGLNQSLLTDSVPPTEMINQWKPTGIMRPQPDIVRLLVRLALPARCVPRRRGFPQGARRMHLAGWFLQKIFPGGLY